MTDTPHHDDTPDDALRTRVDDARRATQQGLGLPAPPLDGARARLRRRHRVTAAGAAVAVVAVVAVAGVGLRGRTGSEDTVVADAPPTSTTAADVLAITPDTRWSTATLAEDGRTLEVMVGSSRDGPCGQSFTRDLVETDARVTIAFDEQPQTTGDDDAPCTADVSPQRFTFVLDRPLGDRPVYDGVDEAPRMVWRRSEVVAVTWLPPGFTRTVVSPGGGASEEGWDQLLGADGADWQVTVRQEPAGSFRPEDLYVGSVEPVEPRVVTVDGHDAVLYEYLNGTAHVIHWVEGGLDIRVDGEMQGPPTFTHDEDLLRIADGIRLP